MRCFSCSSRLLLALVVSGCVGSIGGSDDGGPGVGGDASGRDARAEDARARDAEGPDAPAADGAAEDAGVDGAAEVVDAAVELDAEVSGVDVVCQPWPLGVDNFDQSVVPLEVEPLRGSSVKVVLVAGRISGHPSGQHEYFAGMSILAHLLCQTPGVVPVIVRDGWPTRDSVFDGAAAIVFYADGGTGHPLSDPAHQAVIQRHIDRGVGFAALHYAVEPSPESAALVRSWLGGNYEGGYSINPDWDASYDSLGAHPILRGITPFAIRDEWYYDMRWVDGEGVTPLLSAVPPDSTRTTPDTMAHPGRSETTAWAYERPAGGRSFGFTGGHYNDNWYDLDGTPFAPMQRRLVTNGILWTAGVEIPPEGAPVVFDPALNFLWKDRR